MTSGQGDVIFSPESTVTSLLASSGHLRGTLSDPDLSLTCIRYRDRDYESATEALEAYIADFDRSLHTSETSTGRPQLQKILISSAPLRTELRNKDVLRERLTDKELDLLYLPVVSGRCRDSDCLSLTTDDLLVLPSDGSLPVTRTSAFLTQSGDYPLGQSSHSNSWSSGRLRPNRSSHIKHCLHYSAPHNTPHKLYQSRAGTRAGKTQKTEPFTGLRSSGPRVKGSLRPQPQHGLYHQTPGPEVNQRDLPPPDSPGPSSPHHNYPRWLTSQKSEMDFSGVTSIPDLKYPAWLQECDNVPKYIPTTSIDLSESRKKTQHRVWGPTQTLPPSPRPPSWLGKLEASYEELRKGQKDSNGGHLEDVSGSDDDRQQLLRGEADHKTLRELRLQFAERLALAAEEERSTDFDKLFRDDKIESLILKAEKALDSPSLGLKTNTQLQNSPSLGLTSQLQNSPSLGLTSQLQNSPSLGLTSQLQNSPSVGLTSQLQNSPSLGLTSQLQNSPSLGLTSQLQNSPSVGLTSQLQNSPSLGLTSQMQNSPSLGLTSQMQNSPSLGLTSQLQKDMGHSPGGSEDVLEADRSWDNPAVTFKSPVPIVDPLITTEPLRHRKDEAASGSCSSGYSSRKHPGPVEALKQMLFSLQAVEQQVSLENDSTPYQAPTLKNDTKPLIKMSDDYDTSLGGQSLQRALHHLGKLKSLVEDSPGGKERQEGKTSRRPDISL